MADKTMVDYTAKIKPYFQGVAPVEPTTTAAAAYSAGEQFYLDGTLVEALTSIAIGDTLTLNTNYKVVDPIETQLRQVKQALSDEVSARADLGAHNLMPYDISKIISTMTGGGSWSGNTWTSNSGVIVQLNDDGSVTVSTVAGGASTNTGFVFLNQKGCIDLFKKYKGQSITFSGGKNDVEFGAQGLDGTGVGYYSNNNEITISVANDIDTNPQSSLAVKILVRQGKIITTPVTIYPWFRLATDSDSTFAPYAETNLQLTQNKVSWEDNALNGVHNHIDASTVTAQGGSTTLSNVTSKGFTIAVTDTTYSGGKIALDNLVDGNEYNLIFDVTALSPSNATFWACIRNSSNAIVKQLDFVAVGTKYKLNFTYQSGYYISFLVTMATAAEKSATFDNVMVCDAVDNYDGYSGFAMTNQQLTDVVADNSFTIGESNCSFTVKKKCGVVSIMRHYVSSLTADTDVTVGTLPEGYRPSEAVRVYATAADSTYAEYQIGTDGVFKVRSSTANFILPLVATFIP